MIATHKKAAGRVDALPFILIQSGESYFPRFSFSLLRRSRHSIVVRYATPPVTAIKSPKVANAKTVSRGEDSLIAAPPE
jgi:hypothetical protein